MSFTSTDFIALRDVLLSKISTLGLFADVIDHDPVSAPTNEGLVACVIGGPINPITTSGLSSVDIRVEFVVRIMLKAFQDPMRFIDSEMAGAASAVMEALANDCDLGQVAGARQVDFFGSEGEPMRALNGYLDIDRTKFRIYDVYVPVLINNAYDLG